MSDDQHQKKPHHNAEYVLSNLYYLSDVIRTSPQIKAVINHLL